MILPVGRGGLGVKLDGGFCGLTGFFAIYSSLVRADDLHLLYVFLRLS
jgi:hypothetical protein